MIELVTGKPGHGKSQLVVAELLDMSKRDGWDRPVFCNIAGLDHEKLRTFPLDAPESWPDLPDGSLIIIDECQRWFRPRANGAAVPRHVAELETHRHRGHDLIFITQHPKLLDSHARNLIERHRHCERPFGSSYRRVFEYQSVCDSPGLTPGEKDAQSTRIKFRPDVFKLYKSATVHTHTARLPWKKLGMLGGGVVLVAFLFYRGLMGVAESANVIQPELAAAEIQPPEVSTVPAEQPPESAAAHSLPEVQPSGGESPQPAAYPPDPDAVVAVTASDASGVWVRIAGEVVTLDSVYSWTYTGAVIEVYGESGETLGRAVVPSDMRSAVSAVARRARPQDARDAPPPVTVASAF